MDSLTNQMSQMTIKHVAPDHLHIPVKTASEGLRAVTHIILKHTADALEVIVAAIAEKYGISEEEMTESITSHPRYKELYVSPIISDMGYLPPAAPAEESSAMETESQPQTQTKPIVRKFKLLKKVSAKSGE